MNTSSAHNTTKPALRAALTKHTVCFLLVGLAGCGAELATPDELEQAARSPYEGGAAGDGEVAVTSQAILNGDIEDLGHKGVIAVGFTDADGLFNHSCTGVLVSPKHLLTAAHCTDQGGTGRAIGEMRRTIRYFKPGSAGFVVATAHNELLTVDVIETWDGLRNKNQRDVQDDIALVTRRNGNWLNTTASDYLPIWAGSMSTVDINRVYGAGYPEGPIFGRLRSTPVDIKGSKTHFFWDLAGGRRICNGDSGGPYLDMVPDNQAPGGYREVALGIVSWSEGGDPCTSAGGEQHAARIGSRIAWFRTHMGRSCVERASIAFCNAG